MKEDLNKWKEIPYSWKGRLTVIKMAVLLKAIYKFNSISLKILMDFFPEMEKLMPKLV